jgi:hypothetical protein
MKRSIILGIIAIALVGFYSLFMDGIILPLCIFLVIIAIIIWWEWMRKRNGEKETGQPQPSELTVDDLTTQFGQPEDVILLNAVRANEALGVILVYKDFFVIEGRRVDKSAITDVTLNNSGTPYVPGEYQVIIATNNKQTGYIHVNASYDAAWASDVAKEIKKHIE